MKETQYQWVKGEHLGTVEKITETKDTFTYFQSGRRISTELLTEFLLPINHAEQIINIPGTNNSGLVGGTSGYSFQNENTEDIIRDAEGNAFNTKSINMPIRKQHVEKINATVEIKNVEKKESPITLLVTKAIKDKIKVKYEFEIEIPKPAVYDVISESFDIDLDKEIIEVVFATIDIKELKTKVQESIHDAIKNYYKSKSK
jgi:hypothetical protein